MSGPEAVTMSLWLSCLVYLIYIKSFYTGSNSDFLQCKENRIWLIYLFMSAQLSTERSEKKRGAISPPASLPSLTEENKAEKKLLLDKSLQTIFVFPLTPSSPRYRGWGCENVQTRKDPYLLRKKKMQVDVRRLAKSSVSCHSCRVTHVTARFEVNHNFSCIILKSETSIREINISNN